MVTAYRHTDRKQGHDLLRALIDSLARGVPTALTEIRTLGRTQKRRAADILAFFAHPGTSNGLPKRSTAVWNTCAAPPWASETSPTTSPERSWKSADSDNAYTVNSEVRIHSRRSRGR